MKKIIDRLFVFVYTMTRKIKKDRGNQSITSNWLSICFSLNVNTIIVIMYLMIANLKNGEKVGGKAFILLIPFIFFHFFNERYFIRSGKARELTINLKEHEKNNIVYMWIGIIYSILSVFLFWAAPFIKNFLSY